MFFSLVQAFRDLIRRIPIMYVIALFGLGLTAVAWLNVLHRTDFERAEEISRIYQENDGLARALEEHARRIIHTADSALLFLQMEYEKHDRVTESMLDYVERAKRDPILNQIALSNAQGDLLLSAVPMKRPINIAHREHFQKQSANADLGLYFSKPLITQVSGTWSFFLSRRLNRPDGSFAGIVSAGLNPKYFSDYYGVPELGAERTITLVGRDGIVRARRFRDNVAVGQDLSPSQLFKEFSREPNGHFESASIIDGLLRFFSYRAMPDYPLVVVVGNLKSYALSSAEKRQTVYFLSTLLFTLFVAGFCLLLMRAESRTRRQNARLTTELAERKKVEDALRESQELFSAFMDHLPAVVFVKDLSGRVLYSNQTFRDLFGVDMIGRNTLDLPTPDKGAVERMVRDDERTVREGSITQVEAIPDRDGRERIFETRKFLVDRAGKEPQLGGIAIDISDRQRAEEERLVFERKILQTQKLESLGVLAGGIAHDFNNLLLSILGNADLALGKAAPDSPVRSHLQSIDQAAQRASDLTNQMLAYSGKGRFVIEPVNLSRLVEEMGHLLATVISKRATLQYHLAANLPPVEADATQIRQVVMNLITNASDALDGREGLITVTTSVVQEDASRQLGTLTDQTLPAGRYVSFEVTDTGHGMDLETQNRIFDPFFSTKFTGRGLGLAAVLGIVRGHRGGIRVFSEPGQGSTFKVLFPVAVHPATATIAQPPPEVPAAVADAVCRDLDHQCLILLVDDEENVRTTAALMLGESGFTVITAADGVEGVEVFRAKAGVLAAVVLDLTMPRMGGEETFREMHGIDPDVPVILSSGYSESDVVNRFSGKRPVAFIQKPYRIKELAEKIRSVVAARLAQTP